MVTPTVAANNMTRKPVGIALLAAAPTYECSRQAAASPVCLKHQENLRICDRPVHGDAERKIEKKKKTHVLFCYGLSKCGLGNEKEHYQP